MVLLLYTEKKTPENGVPLILSYFTQTAIAKT